MLTIIKQKHAEQRALLGCLQLQFEDQVHPENRRPPGSIATLSTNRLHRGGEASRPDFVTRYNDTGCLMLC